MADVSVRPARPEDAEQMAHVQLTTWQEAYASLVPVDLPLVEVAAVWLNAIEAPPSPQHRVLVALERHELVGFAASQPSDEAEGAVELSELLVEPRWGRRGHASRLLAASVDHWRPDFALALTWVFEQDTVMIDFLTASGWDFDGMGRGLETEGRVVRQRRMHTDLTDS